jgi:isopentenyldiphosphate isomerase
MPARILRGQPSPNKDEGLEDYAWCTMEEVKERVNNDEYYKSIERALSA